MTRFSSNTVDLSRVKRSEIWPEISFSALLDARMARLQSLFDAAGIEYDVASLETDPSKILQESDAYREFLLRHDINDAQANVMLAFAVGKFLDRLGDAVRTPRLENESDERYRSRVQLAPEAFASSGTPGGYIYFAASASADVQDVSLFVRNRGRFEETIEITVLSSVGDGTPSDAMLIAIRRALLDPTIRHATDNIEVRGAKITRYDIIADLYILPGPDHATVKTNAATALAIVAARYRRIGADIPLNALSAALYVPGVDKVVMRSPVADVTTLRFETLVIRDVVLNGIVANG